MYYVFHLHMSRPWVVASMCLYSIALTDKIAVSMKQSIWMFQRLIWMVCKPFNVLHKINGWLYTFQLSWNNVVYFLWTTVEILSVCSVHNKFQIVYFSIFKKLHAFPCLALIYHFVVMPNELIDHYPILLEHSRLAILKIYQKKSKTRRCTQNAEVSSTTLQNF